MKTYGLEFGFYIIDGYGSYKIVLEPDAGDVVLGYTRYNKGDVSDYKFFQLNQHRRPLGFNRDDALNMILANGWDWLEKAPYNSPYPAPETSIVFNTPQCECGNEKLRLAGHSNWCPKYA